MEITGKYFFNELFQHDPPNHTNITQHHTAPRTDVDKHTQTRLHIYLNPPIKMDIVPIVHSHSS